MTFWYASVGFRLALMFCSHLSPDSFVYQLILPVPLSISAEPTVDRSLQAIRLRCLVTLVMALAEFFAGALRIAIWTHGLLDLTQQEMMLKNFLFIVSVYSAYSMWTSTKNRSWNKRSLVGPILKPLRITQRQIFRFAFTITYLLVAGMLTSYLIQGSGDAGGQRFWICNLGVDLLLLAFFLWYCRNVHYQKVRYSHVSMAR